MQVPVLEPSPLAGEGGTRSVTDEGEEGTKTPPGGSDDRRGDFRSGFIVISRYALNCMRRSTFSNLPNSSDCLFR